MALILALVLGRLIPHAPEGPAAVAKAAMASSPCSSNTPRSEHYFIYYYDPGTWADFIALGHCSHPLTPQTPPSRLIITKVQISPFDRGQAEILGSLYLGNKEIPNFHIHMICRGGGRGGCDWRIDGWS